MYLIGIAGGSGSGKTTFAEKIIKKLPKQKAALLHMDNYYLDKQPESNYIEGHPNFDSPMAFDWELFKKHLLLLKNGKKIECPVYDFSISRRSKKKITVGPCDVVVIEGILSLWDETIRNLFDLKIYLKVEADIRFTRRLHRDLADRSRTLDQIIGQYYQTVRPMHLKFTQPTQQYADIIVGEHHDTAVEVIVHQSLTQIKRKNG